MAIGHGFEDPSIAQIAVFLFNRIGQLRDVLRVLDGAGVEVLGMTVSEDSDCAILRLIPDNPAIACFSLRDKGYALAESEVLAVETEPGSSALLRICQTLLAGEINIRQAYPITVPTTRRNAIVLATDSRPNAIERLREANFVLLDGEDLKPAN